MRTAAICHVCSTPQPDPAAISCAVCGGPLVFRYDLADVAPDESLAGMWRHWRLLPVDHPRDLVTLREGGTPLLDSRLTDRVRLVWKDETRNPTGSHKDRAMSLALTHARRQGARVSVVVSAGSTGLSNAAYAARAGLPSVTLIPAGAPAARLLPLAAYGSRLIQVSDGIDAAIEALRLLSGVNGISVASTTRASNPVQAEAVKTIAHEIVEQLGDAPDWVLVPTGGGGTISALWLGFQEALALGWARRLPRMAAVVPQTHAAVAVAFEQRLTDRASFDALPFSDETPSILTKLAHAHPPDGMFALEALRDSNGAVVAVDEADAVRGIARIGAADGLFLEPSGGVLAPGLDQLLDRGTIAPGALVVGVACGSGFRESFLLNDRLPLVIERHDLASLRDIL